MSSITYKAMAHKYEVISLKLNIVKICTNRRYAQKWITKQCNY